MGEQPKIPTARLRPSPTVAFGRRIFRRFLLRAGLADVVELPGRRTGEPVRVTLARWEVDGIPYLMSQYGETDWVRNLRAAGGGQLRHKGRMEAFRAVEVDGEERERVIAAFRSTADKLLNREYDRLPSSADHPTFRVELIG
ncbi:MAG TPA: nitroreductase family deazaflavin-dependent oxidoreductase [Methylomirabilota bacterium]|nr:nitroreductase family deazaflavin-dependent oxidoreductase [Methylomirabilota bacterium]